MKCSCPGRDYSPPFRETTIFSRRTDEPDLLDAQLPKSERLLRGLRRRQDVFRPSGKRFRCGFPLLRRHDERRRLIIQPNENCRCERPAIDSETVSVPRTIIVRSRRTWRMTNRLARRDVQYTPPRAKHRSEPLAASLVSRGTMRAFFSIERSCSIACKRSRISGLVIRVPNNVAVRPPSVSVSPKPVARCGKDLIFCRDTVLSLIQIHHARIPNPERVRGPTVSLARCDGCAPQALALLSRLFVRVPGLIPEVGFGADGQAAARKSREGLPARRS